MKLIINMCNENLDLLYYLIEIVREGFIVKGCGVVMFVFFFFKVVEFFIKSGVEYFCNFRNMLIFFLY